MRGMTTEIHNAILIKNETASTQRKAANDNYKLDLGIILLCCRNQVTMSGREIQPMVYATVKIVLFCQHLSKH